VAPPRGRAVGFGGDLPGRRDDVASPYGQCEDGRP
jgi:hypothetical protein